MANSLKTRYVARAMVLGGLAVILEGTMPTAALAGDHNTVAEVIAAMERDAKEARAKEDAQKNSNLRKVANHPKSSQHRAAQQSDKVAGFGILDDAFRARAFLAKIPSFERARLNQGIEQYQKSHALALMADKASRQQRLAEGAKLYDKVQKRYHKLYTDSSATGYLTERVRDDIAYNQALLAFRHSSLFNQTGKSAKLLVDALAYLGKVSATRAKQRAEVPFLKARIWEEMGRNVDAAAAYRKIATSTGPASLAKALALVYSGDDDFSSSLYTRSITRYQAALTTVESLVKRNPAIQQIIPPDFRVMVNYRLMWGYHRNVDQVPAVTIAKTLLDAREPLRSRSDQHKLDQDSIDILTEAVLEDFSFSEFSKIAKGIAMKANRLAFATQVTDRLLAKNQLTEALPVLKWRYHQDPLDRGLAVTMTQLALVYRAQEADGLARQAALDLIKIFEPGSLWRKTHGLTQLSASDQQPVIRDLVAKTLSQLYSHALGDPSQASAVASYHKTWLDGFLLNTKEQGIALERLARLQLMQGDIKGSERYAQRLAALQSRPAQSSTPLDVDIAFKRAESVANGYKKAKARSRSVKWQAALKELSQKLTLYQESKGFDPDHQIIADIASFYQNYGKPNEASQLWRSQLEAGQSRYTRSAALTALVQQAMAARDYSRTLRLIEQYTFGSEQNSASSLARQQPAVAPTPQLVQVYKKALVSRFKGLKAKGQLARAAHGLQQALSQYGTNLKDTTPLYNLVFQSLAVTSQWQTIISSYEELFGKHKAKQSPQKSAQVFAAYCLALERTMRYLAAAEQYYQFALSKATSAPKREAALHKAFALAEGEEAYNLAGTAAFAIAKDQQSLPMAQRYYRLAAKNYAKDDNRQGVKTVLAAQAQSATTLSHRTSNGKGKAKSLKAQQNKEYKARLYLTLAHNARAAGNWQEAIRYAKQAITLTKSLPVEDFSPQYRKILAESYYILARQHVDHVRAKEPLPSPRNLKPRLKRDLATIKKLGTYSQQIERYGDFSDKLKIYSLLAVTSQSLAKQLADVNHLLSQQGDTAKLSTVQRVQSRLHTLARHYFGKADITLAKVSTGGGKIAAETLNWSEPNLAESYVSLADIGVDDGIAAWQDPDKIAATAIAEPSMSMFSPDSYTEGEHNGTSWVH